MSGEEFIKALEAGDLPAVVGFLQEPGADAVIDAALREHMRKHGMRSILEIVERMDDITARLGEFVDTGEEETP